MVGGTSEHRLMQTMEELRQMRRTNQQILRQMRALSHRVSELEEANDAAKARADCFEQEIRRLRRDTHRRLEADSGENRQLEELDNGKRGARREGGRIKGGAGPVETERQGNEVPGEVDRNQSRAGKEDGKPDDKDQGAKMQKNDKSRSAFRVPSVEKRQQANKAGSGSSRGQEPIAGTSMNIKNPSKVSELRLDQDEGLQSRKAKSRTVQCTEVGKKRKRTSLALTGDSDQYDGSLLGFSVKRQEAASDKRNAPSTVCSPEKSSKGGIMSLGQHIPSPGREASEAGEIEDARKAIVEDRVLSGKGKEHRQPSGSSPAAMNAAILANSPRKRSGETVANVESCAKCRASLATRLSGLELERAARKGCIWRMHAHSPPTTPDSYFEVSFHGGGEGEK